MKTIIRCCCLPCFLLYSLGSFSSSRLTPYLPEKPNGVAVIVCPGGSYCWHDYKTEGDSVAKSLVKEGITAFVLDYRVATGFAFASHYRYILRGNQYPDMLIDVQNAIVEVRRNAGRYHIDKDRIGVMGFSAGGHLALMSAAFYRSPFSSTVSLPVDRRPDFIAAIYPVVSMSSEYTHKRSRRGALGEYRKRDKMMQDSLSMEKKTGYIDCPVFLMNCKDDPVVDYHNSVMMDSALTANDITHKYLSYQTGGHGFGTTDSKTSAEASGWFGEFIAWLKDLYR